MNFELYKGPGGMWLGQVGKTEDKMERKWRKRNSHTNLMRRNSWHVTSFVVVLIMGIGRSQGMRAAKLGTKMDFLMGGRLERSTSFVQLEERIRPLHGRCQVSMFEEIPVPKQKESPFGKVQKALGSIPKPIVSGATAAAIPLGFALGYAVTPSTRKAVNLIGGAISGFAMTQVRQRIMTERKKLAPVKVLNRIEEIPVSALTQEDIESIRDDFSLSIREWYDTRVNVFDKIFSDYLNNPNIDLDELYDLIQIAESLEMDGEMLGNALFASSRMVNSRFIMWATKEELQDENNVNTKTLDKLLFFTSRLLREFDHDEARNYELRRIAKLFELSIQDLEDRIVRLGVPFYKNLLKDVTQAKKSLEPSSQESLSASRELLGINPTIAKRLHRECYRQKLVSIVQEAGKIDSLASSRLSKVEALLDLSSSEVYDESIQVFYPIVSKALVSSVNDLMGKNPDVGKCKNDVEEMIKDLTIPKNYVQEVLLSISSKSLSKHFTDASKAIRKADGKAVVVASESMVRTVNAASTLADSLFQEKSFVQKIKESCSNDFATPNGRENGLLLYQSVIKTSLNDDELDENEETLLKELKSLLSIPDPDAASMYKDACLVKARPAIKVAVKDESFEPESKLKISAYLDRLKAPPSVLPTCGMEIYRDKVEIYSEGRRIPSSAEKQLLDTMKSFFDLNEEKVNKIHFTYFGSTFKESIVESMGPTGIVPQELKEALEKLRQRLGLQLEDAKNIFYSSIKQRMVPMLKGLENEMERMTLSKDQLAAKSGRDLGDDPLVQATGTNLGIQASGSFMSEVMNMVDYYRENEVLVMKNESTIDTNDKVTYSTSFEFPVDLHDVLEETIRKALYQQFVVSSFATPGPAAARYQAAQEIFAGILGLSKESVSEIRSSMASVIIGRFISSVIFSKNKIEPQDMIFIVNLQSQLNLSEEETKKIVEESKKRAVAQRAAGLYKSITKAKDCQIIRELVTSCDLDLSADAGFDTEKRGKMFRIEIDGLVMEGAISKEDRGDLEELRVAYALSEEEAENLLSDLTKTKVKETFTDAIVAVRSRFDDQLVQDLENVMRYLRIFPVRVELSATKDERLAMVQALETHQAEKRLADGSPESNVDDVATLKYALRLEKAT